MGKSTNQQKVFNPELLSGVQPPPFTENINLSYSNQNISPEKFDLINRKIIHNQLMDEDQDRISIVHPGTSSLLIQSLLQTSVTSLYQNLFEENQNILNQIDKGDIVIFEGSRVRYQGQETVQGNSGFWVSFEGQDGEGRSFQPLEYAYKLDTYEGGADSLESLSNERGAEQDDKETISKLYGIPTESLAVKPEIKIVVVTSKTSIKSHLRNLYIEDHLFTELFPVGDYKSDGDYTYLTGSKSSSEADPFIALTHKFNLAEDIIRQWYEADDPVDALIMDGYSKLKYHHADIDRVFEEGMVNNEVRLLERSEIIDEGFDNHSNLKKWFWTNQEIEQLHSDGSSTGNDSNPFRLQSSLLTNISRRSYQIHDVNHSDVDQLLEDTIQILLNLSNEVERKDFKINRFFSKSFEFYFLLKELCVSVDTVENFRRANDKPGLIEALQELKSIPDDLTGLYITEETADDMKLAIENLIEVVNLLETQNKKADFFEESISSIPNSERNKSAIAVNNSHLRKYLDKELEDNQFHILELSQIARDQRTFKNLIFPGYWYKSTYNRLINTGKTLNHEFVLYENESKWLNKFLTKLDRNEVSNLKPDIRTELLDLEAENADILATEVFDEELQANDTGTRDTSKISDLEEYISNANVDYIQEKAEQKSEESSEQTVQARLFEFQDEYIAYLTKSYSAYVFNRIEEDIDVTPTDELQEGDELIFQTDRESVFQPFLEELEQKEEYQELKEWSNKWQDSLREYAKSQGLPEQNKLFQSEDDNLKIDSDSEILEELSEKLDDLTGIKRQPATIKRWINRDVLNPDNADIIVRAIAEITGDQALKSSMGKVLDACRRRHGIHTKLGRKVAEFLLESAFKSDPDESKDWELIKDIEIDQDLENSIQIVTIQNIIQEPETVTSHSANELIDVSS